MELLSCAPTEVGQGLRPCGHRGPHVPGTAVVRLAIAGATVPQIAAVTGHSLKDVEAILDTHYLGRDIQLAKASGAEARSANKTVNGGVNRRPLPRIETGRCLEDLVGAPGLEPGTR